MGWLYTQGHFYGVADDAKFRQGLELLQEAVPLNRYCYCGDNLITFGKHVSFMNKGPFKDALLAAKPDPKENSIAWRTYTLSWAAKQALSVPGDFVEAGVWRGHSVQVVCNYLGFEKLARTYWLYDRFSANPDQSTQIEDVDETMYRRVCDRFAAYPNIRVIKGPLPDSLAEGAPDRIAFLHLDMNSAAAEVGTLEALWPRMSPGGIIILDDFGWGAYDDQHRVEKAWFEACGRSVLELPTGQGMVIV